MPRIAEVHGMVRLHVLAVAAVAALQVPLFPAQAGPRAAPPVIAFVGEAGVNVLHEEFALDRGAVPRFPAGMPRPVRVELPSVGSWTDRIEQLRKGPLGNLRPGVLYWVAGTRLLVVTPDPLEKTVVGGGEGNKVSISPADPGPSLNNDLWHGTGVVGAAIGRTTGTAPDALALLVSGYGPRTWGYLAKQNWVDVVSVSGASGTDGCAAVPAARALREGGRLPFAAAGNTTDVEAPLLMPNGLPEFFHVGGVDEAGRTRLVPQPHQPTPWFAAAGPQRPYDAGELFVFPAPESTSLGGISTFGGTSGASPRMAGRAAVLIAEARRILGSTGSRGKNLTAGASRPRPRSGPLVNGQFTADELEALLHATAVPGEPDTPIRYEIEGFGAVTDASMTAAAALLRGGTPPGQRPNEAVAHARAESARAALAGSCG